MAGRGEEQAWAPWEEGSRAPCSLGRRQGGYGGWKNNRGGSAKLPSARGEHPYL
jgi:hypothetical protein